METAAFILLTIAMWGGAIYCWIRYNRYDGNAWLACAIGCVVVAIAFNQVVFKEEGAALNADCYVDWDGRANRTVCD